MWEYNAPPVAAPRSLEGEDEFSLSPELGFTSDYTSTLFDTQHIPDITTTTFGYSNTPQTYQFETTTTTIYRPDGSPSHVPLSPTLSPVSTLSPSYTVPSPNSNVPSPSSPEDNSQQYTHPQDIKIQPFLHKKRVKPGHDAEQWDDYVNPAKAYSDLYDSHNVPISKDIAIRTRIVADHMEYSHVDDAHILYRQNQFSLEIDFIGDLAQYSSTGDEPFHVLKRTSSGSSLVPTEGLFFYIYAVKHQRGQPFSSKLVELTQACGSRNQKETQAPSLCPIKNGRAMYSKLQFKAATSNNARSSKTAQTPYSQQQFYRIIVALVAKTSDSLDFVCSRISPFLIVRGQNPGRFPKPLPPIPDTPPATPDLPPSTPITLSKPLKVDPSLAPSTPPAVPPKPMKSDSGSRKRARTEKAESAPISVPSPDLIVQIAPTPTPIPAFSPAPVHLPVPVPAPAELPEYGSWTAGKSTDAVCIGGKVGINTKNPTEALSVVGNIMLTGSIVKPSDKRVKTDVQPVNTASQLATIEALQIYDYKLVHGKGVEDTNDVERGILAQQLQQILPSATRTVNNVTMADGAVVDELIVVEDRALLFENIGATKELSSMVKKDQEMLQSIDQKFDSRIQEESIAAEKTLTAAGKLLDYILVEKNDESEKENVCCVFVARSGKGFYGSLFGLGPAWTLYMLGFFCPVLWFFGSFFILSHSKAKKISGSLHFITFFLTAIIGAFIYYPDTALPEQLRYAFPVILLLLGLAAVGVNGLRWNWKQNARLRARAQRRRVEAKNQKLALMRATKPGKVILKTTRKPKSHKKTAYVSIPMDDMATMKGVPAVARTPSSREDARAIAKAINAKRAQHAETEWERNVLMGTTNPWA